LKKCQKIELVERGLEKAYKELLVEYERRLNFLGNECKKKNRDGMKRLIRNRNRQRALNQNF